MTARKTVEDQEKFVLEFVDKHGSLDVCNGDFHDAYHARFGGKRIHYRFGAQPVPEAMARVKALYQRGVLSRAVISLGYNWQPGFPKWVYSYFRPGK